MDHMNNDAWLFGVFGAETELPASLEDRLAQDYDAIRRESQREGNTMKKNMKKTARTCLALAAAAAALTVSALAIYRHNVKDTVIEAAPRPDYTESGEMTVTRWPMMSANGFADSPEYQAYLEWEEFNAQWQVENASWFSDRGVDDTYHETPDNYAGLYGAYAREQAEKLDEIMAKYSLSAHTAMYPFTRESQLCRALGIVDILADDLKTVGEYMYDDGTFRLDATTDVDGQEYWLTLTNAVKGSFTSWSKTVPAEYEEWTYTTKAGRELIIMGFDGGVIAIADLDGCYTVAAFNAWLVGYGDEPELTHAQAEALAEGIDFEAINGCFATDAARAATAASVAEYGASRYDTDAADLADDAGTAAVLDILGSYSLGALPEELYLEHVDYGLPEGAVEDTGYYSLHFSYNGIPNGIDFSYRSLKPGETRLELTDERELARLGDRETACKVGDYDAILTVYGEDGDLTMRILKWLDTERELVFSLGGYRTPDVLEAIALSVTADDPTLATGSAAYAARAKAHQATIDALLDAEQAEYEAYMAERQASIQAAIARMGNYRLTAASLTYQAEWDFSNGVMDWGARWCQDIMRAYVDAEGRWINFTCETSWDKEDESISRNAETFAAQKQSSGGAEEEQQGVTFTDGLSVNGYEAYMLEQEIHTSGSDIVEISVELCWYDAARDVRFRINTWSTNESDSPAPLTVQELISLAETVTEAE